jgi:hypothetical protein
MNAIGYSAIIKIRNAELPEIPEAARHFVLKTESFTAQT